MEARFQKTRKTAGLRGRRTVYLLALAAAVAVVGWSPGPAAAKEGTYVGVKTCVRCHKKKSEGEQRAIWEKSKHAKAWANLASSEAKEKAAKLGVSGDPQKAPACLICHTTGFGRPEGDFGKSFKVEEGVQCEACHGAGSNYRKKKTMKAIWEERGPDRKGMSATAKKVGLITPDENSCKTCHSEQRTFNGKVYKNPSFKPFDFKERYKKIKHTVPPQ